jgi:hypothetical protein
MSDHDPEAKQYTLIVAPTVAILQWRNEFNKFTSCFKVSLGFYSVFCYFPKVLITTPSDYVRSASGMVATARQIRKSFRNSTLSSRRMPSSKAHFASSTRASSVRACSTRRTVSFMISNGQSLSPRTRRFMT